MTGEDNELDRPVEEIALEMAAGLKCCQSLLKDFRARIASKSEPEEKAEDAPGSEHRTSWLTDSGQN